MTISKKAFALTGAKLEDLKAGDRVVIQTKEGKNDQADRVLLISATKKKKPAN